MQRKVGSVGGIGSAPTQHLAVESFFHTKKPAHSHVRWDSKAKWSGDRIAKES